MKNIKNKSKLIKSIITIIAVLILVVCIVFSFTGCSYDENKYTTDTDINNTQNIVNNLVNHQQTPTDIDYSLERYRIMYILLLYTNRKINF